MEENDSREKEIVSEIFCSDIILPDIIDELEKDYFVVKPVETTDLINRLKVMLSQK